MRSLTWLGIATAISLGMGGFSGMFKHPVQAVELNGQIYFTRPPLLDNATTTQNTTLVSHPTYYFTLTVPEDAGEPLGRIAITQRDGDTAARSIRYDTDDTRAFTGTRRDRGEELSVQTNFDRDAQTVTVIFDQPVSPGTTVTIGLEAERNPRLGGVYLFGVTAFPAGESPYGQFLGYGRLHFYERDGIDIFSGF